MVHGTPVGVEREGLRYRIPVPDLSPGPRASWGLPDPLSHQVWGEPMWRAGGPSFSGTTRVMRNFSLLRGHIYHQGGLDEGNPHPKHEISQWSFQLKIAKSSGEGVVAPK